GQRREPRTADYPRSSAGPPVALGTGRPGGCRWQGLLTAALPAPGQTWHVLRVCCRHTVQLVLYARAEVGERLRLGRRGSGLRVPARPGGFPFRNRRQPLPV